MGLHPFSNLGNRIETANKLGNFIAEFPKKNIYWRWRMSRNMQGERFYQMGYRY